MFYKLNYAISSINNISIEEKVSAVQDITNSILFGAQIENIGNYLYHKGYYGELIYLIKNSQINTTSNPKNIRVDNNKVAEMFSTHYCQAKLHTVRLYLKSVFTRLEYIGEAKASSMLVDFFDIFIDAFNEIFQASKHYENEVYTRMHKGNWTNSATNLYVSLTKFNKKLDWKLPCDYVKRLVNSYIKHGNEWIEDCLGYIIKIEKNKELKEFISELLEGNDTDRANKLKVIIRG